MAILGEFFSLKANIPKTLKDIKKPMRNFLDNIVGSILWKFEVNWIKIVGGTYKYHQNDRLNEANPLQLHSFFYKHMNFLEEAFA